MSCLKNKKDLCAERSYINQNVKTNFTIKLYHLLVKKTKQKAGDLINER